MTSEGLCCVGVSVLALEDEVRAQREELRRLRRAVQNVIDWSTPFVDPKDEAQTEYGAIKSYLRSQMSDSPKEER